MLPHFTMSLTPLLILGSWFCYACCKILKLPFLKSNRGKVCCSLIPFSLQFIHGPYTCRRDGSVLHQHSSGGQPVATCGMLSTWNIAMQLMIWFQILLNWNLMEIATHCWWLPYWKPSTSVPSAQTEFWGLHPTNGSSFSFWEQEYSSFNVTGCLCTNKGIFFYYNFKL